MKQVMYSLLGLLLVVSGGIEAAEKKAPNTPQPKRQGAGTPVNTPVTASPNTPSKKQQGTPNKRFTMDWGINQLRTCWQKHGLSGLEAIDLPDLIESAEAASKAYQANVDLTTAKQLEEAQNLFWQKLATVRKNKKLSKPVRAGIVQEEDIWNKDKENKANFVELFLGIAKVNLKKTASVPASSGGNVARDIIPSDVDTEKRTEVLAAIQKLLAAVSSDQAKEALGSLNSMLMRSVPDGRNIPQKNSVEEIKKFYEGFETQLKSLILEEEKEKKEAEIARITEESQAVEEKTAKNALEAQLLEEQRAAEELQKLEQERADQVAREAEAQRIADELAEINRQQALATEREAARKKEQDEKEAAAKAKLLEDEKRAREEKEKQEQETKANEERLARLIPVFVRKQEEAQTTEVAQQLDALEKTYLRPEFVAYVRAKLGGTVAPTDEQLVDELVKLNKAYKFNLSDDYNDVLTLAREGKKFDVIKQTLETRWEVDRGQSKDILSNKDTDPAKLVSVVLNAYKNSLPKPPVGVPLRKPIMFPWKHLAAGAGLIVLGSVAGRNATVKRTVSRMALKFKGTRAASWLRGFCVSCKAKGAAAPVRSLAKTMPIKVKAGLWR